MNKLGLYEELKESQEEVKALKRKNKYCMIAIEAMRPIVKQHRELIAMAYECGERSAEIAAVLSFAKEVIGEED